jgi:DNA-binding response OmpR family regulator
VEQRHGGTVARASGGAARFTVLSQAFHAPVTGGRAARAILRGMEAAQQQEDAIRVGALEIHPAQGLALAGGDALSLSVREFGLLVALARSGGRIVRREDLYRRVWGGTLRDGDRSIDVYVHKLRVKLEHALPDLQFIHTHVGFGYRFAPVPAATPHHDHDEESL